MLIDSYRAEIITPQREPGAARNVARARLSVDILEALPYLNATLRGTAYHQQAEELTWNRGGHNVGYPAHEIAVSKVEHKQAAVKELAGSIALVGRTWARRGGIASEPIHPPAATADVSLPTAPSNKL